MALSPIISFILIPALSLAFCYFNVLGKMLELIFVDTWINIHVIFSTLFIFSLFIISRTCSVPTILLSEVFIIRFFIIVLLLFNLLVLDLALVTFTLLTFFLHFLITRVGIHYFSMCVNIDSTDFDVTCLEIVHQNLLLFFIDTQEVNLLVIFELCELYIERATQTSCAMTNSWEFDAFEFRMPNIKHRLVNEHDWTLEGIKIAFSRSHWTFNCFCASIRLELSWHNYLLNANKVIEESRQYIIEFSFNLRLKSLTVFLLNLLRRQIDLDTNFSVHFKIHGDKVM